MSKLYVIVRADLSRSQQAVQAGHAVAQACLAGIPWTNGTLVYLKVRNLDELLNLHNQIGNTFPFYEPDIDMEMTAFARLGGHPEFEYLPLL